MTESTPNLPARQSVELAGASLSLDSLMEVSRVLAVSNLLPQALRGKPADVLITIMYGQELGMTPMESILGIYVVNGRPGLSGQKWLERVRKAGHRAYVPCATCGQGKTEHRGADHTYVADHDDQHCTMTIVRGDSGDEHTETFTWADAERAKLTGKEVWKSWPKRMLLWRAVTTCATVICPEVASGFDAHDGTPPDPVERPTLAQVAAERVQPAEPAPAEPDDEAVAEEVAKIAAAHIVPADVVDPDEEAMLRFAAGGEI
jgi:hypothetical protein